MMLTPIPTDSPLPAAQYLRASTEHQQYSTENQSQAIAQYALNHNLVVAQTYTDEAKSGLGLKRRRGLQELLRDVVAGTPYRAVLVYDVSRWGRFLDTDESAHYEFLCKASGVPVHYCAESFGNEPTFPNLIMKAIKRTMAGEYSWELSSKVFQGMDRIVRSGFRSGGLPAYALRRLVLGSDGTKKQLLGTYDRKCLASDRVVYVVGPQNEVRNVRNIYRMFVEQRMSYTDIAQRLNENGVPAHQGSPRWNYQVIQRILSNPKYTGSMVYNRSSSRLQSPYRILPKSEWIVVPDAFEAIVDQATYQKSQEIHDAWVWNRSDTELLDQLRMVLQQTGRLSTKILASRPNAPSGRVCKRRFGSLKKAYELIGYQANVLPTLELRSRLQTLRTTLLKSLVAMFPKELSLLERGAHWRSQLRHKTGLVFSVRACRSVHLPTKGQCWVVEPLRNENRLVTLLGLANPGNTGFEKFVMLPGIPFRRKVTIGPNDDILKGGVMIPTIDQFVFRLEEIRKRRSALTQSQTQ